MQRILMPVWAIVLLGCCASPNFAQDLLSVIKPGSSNLEMRSTVDRPSAARAKQSPKETKPATAAPAPASAEAQVGAEPAAMNISQILCQSYDNYRSSPSPQNLAQV